MNCCFIKDCRRFCILKPYDFISFVEYQLIHWKDLTQNNHLFMNQKWLILSWTCQGELEQMSKCLVCRMDHFYDALIVLLYEKLQSNL